MNSGHNPAGRRAVPVLWIAGAAAPVLFVGLAWYLAPLDPGIVAIQFAFTPKSFAAIVHAWPPQHLLRYRAHFPFDFVLLACYGAWGYLVATRTALFADRTAPCRTAAAFALPFAAIFDAAENVLQLWLTAAPRFGVPLPYVISTICSALKWLLMVAFALALVHALARDKP